MKVYQAFAATALLVLGYLALEAKAASLEQFRYDFDDQDDAADEQEAEASNAGSAATRSKREDDYGSPYGQELEDRYKRSEEESYDFTDGNMDVDNGYKRAVDKRYVDDYEVEAARSLLEPTPDIVHSNFNNRREPQIPAREEAVRDRRSYDSDSDEYNYDEYYSAETSSDEDEKSCESTTATPDSDYNDDDDFEDASPIPQPEESERTEASPSPVEEPEAAPPKDVEVLYDAPSFLAEATLETPPSPSEGIMIYPVSSDELPVESELSRLRAAPRNQEVEAGQEYRIAGSVYLEAASDENDLNARKKRATGGLEEYQRKFLQMFNELRARHGMPALVLDPALTSAAQAWAEDQAQNLEKKHSCTECTQYAELLAKRRSPRPIPQGIEAAQWVYDSWFVDEDGNDDETYDVIYQNPNFHKLGVGMASRRAPDRSYHAYAVLRVSI